MLGRWVEEATGRVALLTLSQMIEDNTQIVTARKRKPTRHMRLRMETVNRLRALGAKKKAEKAKDDAEKVFVTDPIAGKDQPSESAPAETSKTSNVVKTRKAKVKRATLSRPSIPKAKFRKRQIHKSWLPTHLFHAKRAHMTSPSAPLWRFDIPLTPTQKSYRPTHRASQDRGAIAWDTSYMATIGVEGEQRSVERMLKALGVGIGTGSEIAWGAKGQKWRNGTRVLETLVYEREAPHHLITPATIIWCVSEPSKATKAVEDAKRKRKLFIRVHPSTFYQLWEEVVRLALVVKPQVTVEDLRFEIGSIEIAGPGSTEALLGTLWPSQQTDATIEDSKANMETTWNSLAGVTNPSTLPAGSILGFDVQDPRLHFPPRTIVLPKTNEEQTLLLQLLSSWPIDHVRSPAKLFDRTARLRGSRIPSQKAINRRKGPARPGQDPTTLPTDPQIPALLYTASNVSNKPSQSSWTLLAPWKTIQPIWYALMYYPLTTGTQPRFGGLTEQRQLAFETGRPWFPADFPGTRAGWEWEMLERRERWDEWQRRPKGKRVSWEKVDLGDGRKGEAGRGWACDWEVLLNVKDADGDVGTIEEKMDQGDAAKPEPKPNSLAQLPAVQAQQFFKQSMSLPSPVPDLDGRLMTVQLALLTRGVPQACARIYRLPSASDNNELRQAWLALDPCNQSNHKQRGPKHSLPRLPKDAPPHLVQRRLAQSLLEPARVGEDKYPACPGQEDLIGFVTTGNFNLAEGQGTGIGNVLVGMAVEQVRQNGEEGRLCVVRNAGADVGRLARWEVA